MGDRETAEAQGCSIYIGTKVTSWSVTSSQRPDISKQIHFPSCPSSVPEDGRALSLIVRITVWNLLVIQPLPTLYPLLFCCSSIKTLGLHPDSFSWRLGRGGTQREPYLHAWELGWVPGGDHGGQVRTVCSEMLDNSGPCVEESAKQKWKNRTGSLCVKSRQGEVAKIKMRKAKGNWGQTTIYKKREAWMIK